MQQTADEDAEGISSDAHGQAILEALGLERRNEVSFTAMLQPTLSKSQRCNITIFVAYCPNCIPCGEKQCWPPRLFSALSMPIVAERIPTLVKMYSGRVGICDITCDAELYVQNLEPGLFNRVCKPEAYHCSST